MEIKLGNQLIKVVFKIYCTTEYGECLYLLGNIEELSHWNKAKAIKLHTKDYTHVSPLWESDTLLLPINACIEYKFFKKTREDNLVWEELPNGLNHSLKIDFEDPAEITHFFGTTNMQIELKELFNEDPSPRSRKFTLVMFLCKNRKILLICYPI